MKTKCRHKYFTKEVAGKEKVNFDDYSSNYNEILQKQHSRFGDISYYSEYKVQIVKNLCPDIKKANILEYGCGIGRNLPYLQKLFNDSKIYGFDISKESLKIAKTRNPKVILLNENELIKYEGYFDIIFITAVYHHINPTLRNEITAKIVKLIKSSGKIIIFEHNPYNPITRHMVNTCVFDKDAILLTKSELISLFKPYGLECKNSGYTLFVPPRLKRFNFIEKILKWLPLGGQYYVCLQKK